MKITIDVGLDDLLEEVEDYDDEGYYPSSHYELKDPKQFEAEVKEKIGDELFKSIRYHSGTFDSLIKEFLEKNKTTIIDRVVTEVSKKIINTKAIKDFKKSLED